MRVRLGTEAVLVAAKQLCIRLELDVYLQADYRFEFGHVARSDL